MANNTNSWSYWAEDFPSALYEAMIPQGTPSFQDYWQRQQSKIYGEYMGALGKQALSGQPPSMMFSEFLGNLPWTQRWYGLSPSQRGLNLGQLAPSLQWRV